MRERITLLKIETKSDGYGGSETKQKKSVKVWAEISPVNTSRDLALLVGGGIRNTRLYNVKIRYRNVDETMKVKHKNDVWDILAVKHDNHKWTLLTCRWML